MEDNLKLSTFLLFELCQSHCWGIAVLSSCANSGGNEMSYASIVMPVYNGEKHLSTAIESILSQTFTDFKLIAIDDCSADSSLSILQSYHDKRILIVENDQHRGVAAVLNQGLALADGELVFRMDADDVSFPNRLQCQIDFMKENPNISVCGSDTDLIDKKGSIIGHRDTKKGDQRIKIALFLGETSLAHPAVAIRNAILETHQIQYSEHYPYAEDYEIWCRCSTFSTYENIPKTLLQYRHHNESVSKAHYIRQRLAARKVLADHLYRLGLNLSREELNCHFQFSLGLEQKNTMPTKEQFIQWKTVLIAWNRNCRLFDPALFEVELEQRYQNALKSFPDHSAGL